MKNLINTITILGFVVVAVLSFTAHAIAEDVMMPVTVKSITDGTDKNGAAFKRIIFDEKASLNGITYVKSSMIMVFSDAIDQIAEIKTGETVKLIVNKSDYKGRNSYSLIAVVK
ncbi:MAG: hypothetical protein HQK65_02320 [Desulfamplus sp.]|nr:hypothetical protein [Desulfamplus sp.]